LRHDQIIERGFSELFRVLYDYATMDQDTVVPLSVRHGLRF